MKFHFEVLSKKQKETLNFIKNFKENFILVGGTAIALQLGHRESIDFDLFIPNQEYLPIRSIKKNIKESNLDYNIITETDFHFEIIINNIRITWLAYLHDIPYNTIIDGDFFRSPSLLHLGAMKAHAISRRAKRKDYVDLYFLIKFLGTEKILEQAKNIFGGEFNKKNFLSQISYFDDIDKSEKVVFLPNYEKTETEIKEFLKKVSKENIT